MISTGKSKPDLSVVVITWNQLNLLKKCISALNKCTFSSSLEIIVVDNGSTDGTTDFLESTGKLVKIRNNRNMGVAVARNQGFRASSGRYVLHLDDDTEVQADCLENLVKYMDMNPDVWLSAGKLLNPDGSLQYNARTFYRLPTIISRRTPFGKTRKGKHITAGHLMQNWDHNNSRTVDWVCGACFCMRKSASEKIGLLDEGYFFGMEDLEWAYRVWQSGGRVAYVHDSIAMHHYQRSSSKLFSKKAFYHLMSLIRFHMKHGFGLPVTRSGTVNE